MLRQGHAFSGFSVDDIAKAKVFYGTTLGLGVEDGQMGFYLKVAGGNPIFVYQKEDHVPATYTILNFPVDDIDQVVDELVSRGVKFDHYDEMPGKQDNKGVLRGKAVDRGPDIAWFKDPAGNILSILSD